jgi:multicomponent Na+:H+ antiporter subunit A
VRLGERLDWVYARGPGHWYQLGLDAMMGLARWQTRTLQNGQLRAYVATTVIVTVIVAGLVLVWRVPLTAPVDTDVRAYEAVMVVLMLLGAGLTVTTDSRLAAVAGLGVVGYAVALVFLLYGAPDLALTQFAVETLSVVLFVLVVYRLPRFARLSTRGARVRDVVVASAAGLLMTALVLETTPLPSPSRVSQFFAENSVPQAFGRNVVNVILVDFRALDTLGEVSVVAVAALGVYALLRGRRREGTS